MTAHDGLSMTPDGLIGIILAQVEDNDVDLIVEPSPALVAAWKRDTHGPDTKHRWTAWGPLCLVCHRDVPEGHAVAYPFLIGSRACLGDCATYLDSLLRVYDRSDRGRWRLTRQVHTLANGASCRTCERGAA